MPLTIPTAGSTSGLARSASDLTVPSAWTFYCWYRKAAIAEIANFASFGVPGDPEIDIYFRSSDTGGIRIERYGSGTRGQWSVAGSVLNHSATGWRFIAFTQSGLSTPACYQGNPSAGDTAPVAKTVTVTTAPTGTESTLTNRYPVYGNSLFSATYDGAFNGDMAWAGWHNVVLTLGELTEAMWRGMTLRGLIDHRPMWSTTDKADLAGTGDAGTINGSVSTLDVGPPVRPLWLCTDLAWAPQEAPTAESLEFDSVGGATSTFQLDMGAEHLAFDSEAEAETGFAIEYVPAGLAFTSTAAADSTFDLREALVLAFASEGEATSTFTLSYGEIAQTAAGIVAMLTFASDALGVVLTEKLADLAAARVSGDRADLDLAAAEVQAVEQALAEARRGISLAGRLA